jgi:hypothetical protein
MTKKTKSFSPPLMQVLQSKPLRRNTAEPKAQLLLALFALGESKTVRKFMPVPNPSLQGTLRDEAAQRP